MKTLPAQQPRLGRPALIAGLMLVPVVVTLIRVAPDMGVFPKADGARDSAVADASGAGASQPDSATLHGAGIHRSGLISPRIEEKLARGPKRYDQPAEATQFYVQQRLPRGADQLPLEQLVWAREDVKRRQDDLARRRGAVGFAGVTTWEEIGPDNVGGRTRALVIDPTNPQVMYAGGVAGGVWKTTNGGGSWSALDDTMLNLAVTSLAMDPNDPQTIYAATGEGFFNIDSVRGLGIFKTTDGGATWTQLAGTVSGVPTGAFYYVNDVVISPNDSSRIYAATRTGVWRSSDAGASWEIAISNGNQIADAPVKSNGSGVGCTELAIREDTGPGPDSDVLLAAFGSFDPDGLFRSTDGGDTWTQLNLPGSQTATVQGRMSLAIAPSDNDVMYVCMASNDFTQFAGTIVDVFRSTDGGNTWQARLASGNDANRTLLTNPLAFICGGSPQFAQGWYDNVIAVDPVDPDIVWVGGIDMFRSDDAARNFEIASYWFLSPGDGLYNHADHHAIVFHPDYDGVNNTTMFTGNDGGVHKTDVARIDLNLDICPTLLPDTQIWQPLNNGYGVTQFYHGDSGPPTTSIYGGGTQDNGTNLITTTAGNRSWIEISGGDGGYFFIDPRNTNVMYAATTSISIIKSTNGGNSFSSATSGIFDSGLFIAPYALDQTTPDILWAGGNRPWRSTDAAESWQSAGAGFVPDGFFAQTSAIAISESDNDVVYFGFNTGHIARTDNGLSDLPSWEIFGPLNGLPLFGYISSIAIDPNDPQTAYASSSTFNVAHVLRTRDGGRNWESIDGIAFAGVPDIPVHWITLRECEPGTLFAGTELGVFASEDDGATWEPVNFGFPNTVVETLDWQGPDRLIAFTHGRGAFRAELTPCDCDGNGVPDVDDISGGVLEDCDNNDIPDVCELLTGDCNGNGLLDLCEIGNGLSDDVNGNGKPDECDPDCNSNGLPDDFEVTIGVAEDCNDDGVLDECDVDCDDDGTSDRCELYDSALAAQARDQCASAEPICLGGRYAGSTVGADSDGRSSCGDSSNSPDVWYRYTPARDGFLLVSACASNYDGVISIHSGCPGTTSNQLSCDDDECGLGGGGVTFAAVEAGREYFVRVTGYDGDSGEFELSVDYAEPCAEVVNVDCDENGVLNDCELAAGSAVDCDDDAVPDRCQIDLGISSDCDFDGVPDNCQPDADDDGVIDACDQCDDDPFKITPGDCGCGVADTDTDRDGTPDCVDGCPGDSRKTEPGICGCNRVDSAADADDDGTPDCVDGCPDDPNKSARGVCGCGTADTDSDDDGVPDCKDICTPGDDSIDTDDDGTPDCADDCPEDPLKTEPGQCGCGASDADPDVDGVATCEDNCPFNGNPDQVDTDADGLGDLCDGCPNDAEKSTPGVCGCGEADLDTDGDGLYDCADPCPEIAAATHPDSDRDGAGDACDACPLDPSKTEPGVCGCGVPDIDIDGDGVLTCNDECLGTPLGTTVDERGCPPSGPPAPQPTPVPDGDGDGVPDSLDSCPDTPSGATVDATGCAVSDPPSNGGGDGGDNGDDAAPCGTMGGMGVLMLSFGWLGLRSTRRRR
jgi:photosystem II stability/assembly factor-like uncharacterized protein